MIKTAFPLKLLISFLLSIIVVLGSVQLLATERYLAFEYGKATFPADLYGFDKAQRLAFASSTLRWVREGQPIETLAEQRLADFPLYNQRELKHMQDVQNVFLFTKRSWFLALGLFLSIGLYQAYRKDNFLEFTQGLKIGGLLVAGVIVVIALLAVTAWQVWFVAFHQIFFAAGTWTFNTSDTLIRLFPERFWYDAALMISGLSFTGGLAAALIGWYGHRRGQKSSETRRSHKLNLSEG